MEKILYKRWDSKVFEIKYEQSDKCCIIRSVILLDNCTYSIAKTAYSFNDLKFLIKQDDYGAELDYVQLQKEKQAPRLWFEREAFLKNIELECDTHQTPATAIMVGSIAEYMNVVLYYRYVALLERIRSLATAAIDIIEWQTEEPSTSSKPWISIINLCDRIVPQSKICFTMTTGFNKDGLDTAVKQLEKAIREEHDKQKKANSLSYDDAHIFSKIFEGIKLFYAGETSAYYRGVGHIVFPEIPGVFRGERKLHLYRPELLNEIRRTMKYAISTGIPLKEAADRVRNTPGLRKPYNGFQLLSSRTLLSKGLEFDCVIVDQPSFLSGKASRLDKATNYYVALTRAKKQLFIVCNQDAISI